MSTDRQANRGQSDLECKNQLMDFSPIERMFNFEVPGTYSDHKMKEKNDSCLIDNSLGGL